MGSYPSQETDMLRKTPQFSVNHHISVSFKNKGDSLGLAFLQKYVGKNNGSILFCTYVEHHMYATLTKKNLSSIRFFSLRVFRVLEEVDLDTMF